MLQLFVVTLDLVLISFYSGSFLFWLVSMRERYSFIASVEPRRIVRKRAPSP
jgi:hypothetical protein